MTKLVYLISPNKITKNFYSKLDRVLSFGNTAFFQLRLKNISNSKIFLIAKKLRKITRKHKVKFIINDNYSLALKLKADGCHMGQKDGSFKIARNKLRKKILGITCHNSKKIARDVLKFRPNYLAFGSFYKSKLKPNSIKANLDILRWSNKNIKKPIVVIGGINNKNYKRLIESGAKYIAISSFIWDNPSLKPEFAIKEFK